jgi:hypothetical protein
MTELVYVLFVFTLLFFCILIFLSLFLLIQKLILNIREKRRKLYKSTIFPEIIRYITKGEKSAYRLLDKSMNKWKRSIIIDIIYNLSTVIKSESEFDRLHHLCDQIGLTGDIHKQILDHRWWVATDATRKAGKLQIHKVIPVIKKNLYAKEFDLWTASARALKNIGVSGDLIQFMINREHEVTFQTLERMADMLKRGDESDIDLIHQHIDEVSDPLKGLFLDLLGYRKSVKSLPVIEYYLEHSNRDIRIKALKSISEIRLTSRADLIIECLQVDDWSEQLMAVRASKSCAIVSSLPILEKLVSHNNWWVRLRSVQAIASFGYEGKKRLDWISKNHHDQFARDMASIVLEDEAFGEVV